jgi:predicted Fe-Mo cluster-binding NifX family protein
MNIAVAADGKNLDSEVSEKFEQCLYLLIINVDDKSIIVIKNDELHTVPSEKDLIAKVLQYDCEAVITGTMNSIAFDMFSDAGVTKLMGYDCLVKESLELMNRGY